MPKSITVSVLKRLYPVALAVALFTGFGNMPIYKRYYISDIPGFWWSSNFYVNLTIHYISGALLVGLAVYFGFIYLKTHPSNDRLTTAGMLRAVLLGLSLLTGILLAIRNLSGINFGFGVQMFVVFAHLAMALTLMVLSVGCFIFKSPWRSHLLPGSEANHLSSQDSLTLSQTDA